MARGREGLVGFVEVAKQELERSIPQHRVVGVDELQEHAQHLLLVELAVRQRRSSRSREEEQLLDTFEQVDVERAVRVKRLHVQVELALAALVVLLLEQREKAHQSTVQPHVQYELNTQNHIFY